MQVKKRWGVVGLSLLAGAVGALGMLGGCQSDSDDGGGNGGSGNASSGNPGSGAAGAEGGAGTTTSNGGAGPSTGGGANSGGSGGAPLTCNDAPVTPIADLTNGTVGDQVNVTLEGVVAMSHKFLVSKSNASGSCLYGVYVSAPGLDETGPNTAMLVISYGDEATTQGNGTVCAKLGQPYDPADPTGAGGNIPDWVKPGDVLDIPNGKTSHFLLDDCADETNGSTVKAIQLATHFSGCPIEITGTAPLPTPHVLTPAELAKVGNPDDAAFHDAWGGVFVRANGVTPELWSADCPGDPAPATCLVNKFGQIQTEEGVTVGDKIYYRGYDDNKCHAGPVYDAAPESFDFQGFHTLDFCTWGLFAQDKCADYSPADTDCGADTTCPYTEATPPN